MTIQEQLARREFLKQMTTASAAALARGGTRAQGILRMRHSPLRKLIPAS
jgi:hypothetical protein